VCEQPKWVRMWITVQGPRGVQPRSKLSETSEWNRRPRIGSRHVDMGEAFPFGEWSGTLRHMNDAQIKTRDDLEQGLAALITLEPRFGFVAHLAEPVPLRLRGDGFPALLDIILGQQISVASAAGVRRRLEAAGATTAKGVRSYDEAGLRALGLTRQKAHYIHLLAHTPFDYAALRDLPNDAVIQCLTALKGIGPWSAEIYAMFALGRTDVIAAGDLAIQEATRQLFSLPARPDTAQMREIAQAWAPWRSVAARALWAYYQDTTSREGIG
jgi:DNA-3-methyladenine glycosylase II